MDIFDFIKQITNSAYRLVKNWKSTWCDDPAGTSDCRWSPRQTCHFNPKKQINHVY